MGVKMRLAFAFVPLLGFLVVPARGEEKAPPGSGTVRLPLSDYQELLRAAGRTGAEAGPLQAAFVQSEFDLTADGTAATLRATLEVRSLAGETRSVPLPDLGTVFEAEVSGSGALVSDESGNVSVRLPPGGSATLRLRSAPQRKEENGIVTLSWSVPASPSNHFRAVLPKGFSDVALEGGSGSIEVEGSRVRVEGSLDSGEAVHLTYAAKAPKPPDERLVASASESRLYRIGEEGLAIGSRVRIEVLRGTLSEFTVEAPADFRVVTATAAGNTVTSFESDPGHPDRRTLRLGNPVAAGGFTEVFWLLAREGKTPEGTLTLPELTLPGFLRGEVVVAVVSARPVLLAESESKRSGYERIDEMDLPAELKELTDSPVLFAARRAGAQAPRLALEISTLPELPGLAGVIDQARLLTIVTPLGQRLDRWRLELQTRETLLRVSLPEGEVWSALLDGKPFRPLREGRDLLVPMGRGAAALSQRVLEIVVAAPPGRPLPKSGDWRLELPRLPYSATIVFWDLFLPDKSQYRVRGGTVAEPPRAPGGAPLADAGRAGDLRAAAIEAYGTAHLSGKVVDQNGAPLPGVTVTVTGTQGWQRSTTSDKYGHFQFVGLPAGQAQVQTQLSGFATTEQALDIRGDANLSMTIPLSLGKVAEVVNVVGEAPGGTLGGTSAFSSVQLDGADRTQPRTKAAPPPAAAKPAVAATLSGEERAALQRTTQAGIATIPVDLPTTGKRLTLAGYLLIVEPPRVEIQIRPVRKGWFW